MAHENYLIEVEPGLEPLAEPGEGISFLLYTEYIVDQTPEGRIYSGGTDMYLPSALTSIVLSAIHEGVVSLEEGAGLIQSIAWERISDEPGLASAFRRVAANVHSLVQSRIRVLIAQAAQGALTLDDLERRTSEHPSEFENLTDLESHMDTHIKWLTMSGLLGCPDSEGQIKAKCFPPDHFFYVSDKAEHAEFRQVGVQVMSYQYELIQTGFEPEFKSARHHISLGNLDETGTYVPTLTLLAPSHPARASSQDS